ncbi:MAG TPA: FtsH protease activity modulator HflK [Verrucomicrobiae bacterium]|jgi:membrane protease subunit HflK|nr:FtsH protease activity modulator HflK [Verrucomicrobiae bacterium]
MKYANSPNSPFNRNFSFKQILSIVVGIAVVAIILSIILTGFYTVPADSQAVLQRFGKYTSTEDPGLHFKIPLGVDTATIIPVSRQLKMEFGYGNPNATSPSQGDTQPDAAKDMVTGDLNEAEVEWVVQYRITDPKQYLFAVQDPEDTLRAASEAVMREVIGDRTIDEVITYGRQDIENENLVLLKSVAQEYELGISIDLVQLKNVNPPEPVQAAFNDVNNAQQEKQRDINQAQGEYNTVVPKAHGQADQMISVAQGSAAQRINEAKGDAAYFNDIFAQYVKAPEVTRRRLYLETMGAMLPKMGNKIIIDDDVSRLLPLLPLTKSPMQ